MKEKEIKFNSMHKLILTTGHLPKMAEIKGRRMIVDGFALERRMVDKESIKNLTGNN